MILSLKDITYNHIKERILGGEIRSGDRLREDLLAEELNISRTPVREAINKLIMEGLVESVPRKGLYCVELTPDDINDLCDMRLMYELYAIKRCVERCTPANIGELKNLAEQFEQAMGCGQSSANTDNLFHTKIIEFADNSQLANAYSLVSNYFQMMRAMLEDNGQIHIADAKEQHFLIIECIESKDKDLAISTIEDHIEKMRKRILKNAHNLLKTG